jgi:hypothetical protein
MICPFGAGCGIPAGASGGGEAALKAAPNCLDFYEIKARHTVATLGASVNALLVGVMPRTPDGAAMPSYRYCFLDSADRIAEFQVIAGLTDDDAQTRADRLLAACDYPGIEVWDRGRHVYRARKPGA